MTFVYRFFEQLIDPLAPTTVTRPPVATSAFFWNYLYPVRWVLLSALALIGINAVADLLLYKYLGDILDWMNTTPPESFLATHSTSLLGMAMVALVIRPLSLLGSRGLVNLAIAPGLANSTRWQNHRYVLRQSMSFFQNDFAGRISQKVMQTGQALREAVINVIDGAWMLIIYLIGMIILFTEIHGSLLIPIGAWVLVYCLVIYFMVPPVRSKSASLSEANSGLIGRVVDSYTNIQAVKLFAHHEMEEDFVATGISRHTEAFRVLMRAILGMTISLTGLNTLLIFATAALSISLWMQGNIPVGEIAVANGLVIRLNQISGWILRTVTALFENIGTVQNGIETISQPTEIADRADAVPLLVNEGAIEFDNVSFGYSPPSIGSSVALEAMSSGGLPVINSCTLTVKPGERVGLVGRSGAGKSTLINLLMRFHEQQAGMIRIDGQDIRGVTQQSLRQQIAVVTQDTSLLHRSVRDNIRYGQSNASDDMVRRAAQDASADFIEDLVDSQGRRGLDAHVGERGVKLSGGQRQRIAIARVILKNAPILVLDEATSALDSEIEAAIQQQLDRLMQGKTVLAVAHRLSTIAALDRLIVLDAGQLVESGSHAELIEQRGLYARLWERQSGGFIGI